MINSNHIVVVLPAYNAARTLAKTVAEIDRDIVDEIILVDDFSADNTAEIAQALSLKTVRHQENKGYGANQKTCFELALSEGADIIIMVHPDYQYSPRLIPAMAFMIASREYDVVLGTRMLGRGALSGGMPLYKFVANRTLTSIENLVFRRSLYFVKDISKDQKITKEHIRSIRPGYGLEPKYINSIVGLKVSKNIKMGSPVKEENLIDFNNNIVKL